MTPVHYRDEPLRPSKYAIIRWFELDTFIPERAVTSYWVSSKTFFAVRFLLTLYSTIVFWFYLISLAIYADFSGFFAQFTTLTFIGLHAYLVTSTVHHFRYLRSKNVNFLLNQPSFLNYLYLYLYCTVITYNILTPVVFWSILNQGVSTLALVNWVNISIHGISFFLMIFDVILNRMTVPIRMVLFVFGTVVLYMVMAFIIYADTVTWVYPFLDWSQGPKAAIWYFVVAIVVVLAFFFMVLVHMLRDWIVRKTGRVSNIPINEEKIEVNNQPTSNSYNVEAPPNY